MILSSEDQVKITGYILTCLCNEFENSLTQEFITKYETDEIFLEKIAQTIDLNFYLQEKIKEGKII